jgi:hypothetical protein
LADVAVSDGGADLEWDPAELALDPDRLHLWYAITLAQSLIPSATKQNPGSIVMMSNGNFDGLKECSVLTWVIVIGFRGLIDDKV